MARTMDLGAVKGAEGKSAYQSATTLANSCYNGMFYGCTGIKLSSTQTGEYTVTYRIPTTGTGTTASSALSNMFTSTGGTFKGTPTINTTYYLSNTNTVV